MLRGLLKIAAGFTEKFPPQGRLPNLDTVGNAYDHGILLDAGKILEILRDDEPSLLVRQNIDGTGKKHAVKGTRLALGKGKVLESRLLHAPFTFREHKKAFVQAAGDEKSINTVLLGNLAKARGQDQTAFIVNAVAVFAVKHRLHFPPLCST